MALRYTDTRTQPWPGCPVRVRADTVSAMDTTQNPPGPWLTRDQAAARLQVSVDTIDRAIGTGELPVRRLGRTVRIHVEHVDALPKRTS